MRILCIYLFTLSLCNAPPALASDFLGLSIGYYNVLDNKPNSVSIEAEYRPASQTLLKPWLNVRATTNGSVWAGGGLLYDWTLNNKWHLTPSIGLGLYNNGAGDIDLGHAIQFRSRIELSYNFENNSRINIGFDHTSNAGLDNTNPGSETIYLSYHRTIEAWAVFQ